MANVNAHLRKRATSVTNPVTAVTPCTTDKAPTPIENEVPAFDTDAIDAIQSRAALIAGLASCAECLSAVEAGDGNFDGYELRSDALPSLNRAILEMATQIATASEQMWLQYAQMRAFAINLAGVA